MNNVQYPFLDLTKVLVSFLNNLKPTDWDKTTLLNNRKVSNIANQLIRTHTKVLTATETVTTATIAEFDTIDELKTSLDILTKLLNTTDLVFEDADCYATCWLLQQYIRQALNNQQLLQTSFYFPFLDVQLQTLAKHYKAIEAEEGTTLKLEVVGEAGGAWYIVKNKDSWKNVAAQANVTVTVYLDQQIAWLLFSNATYVNEIGQFYQIIGDKRVGSHFLTLRIQQDF